MTRADVLRVAKEHFLPENLAIVAVGNPKEFGKPLTALGKVNTLELTIPEPKVETAKSDAQSLARGKELLQRAQQAMGGADKIAAIKDFVEIAEMTMDPSRGGMKIKQQIRWVAPMNFREDQELPIGKIIVYTDGATGWFSSPQGVAAMPAPVLQQAKGEIFHAWLGLILSDRDATRTINAVAPDAIEISTADGLRVRIDFDASGLPSKQTYREAGMGGEVVQSYSDWRAVDGVKLPFKGEFFQDGKRSGQVIVSDLKFNTGLKAEELSKKP